MSTVRPQGPADVPPERRSGREPRAALGVASRAPLIGALRGLLWQLGLRLWATLRARSVGVTVGGVVSELPRPVDLEGAIPPYWPTEAYDGYDELSTEGPKDLARAAAWAGVLADTDKQAFELRETRRVLTTYGFAEVGGRVRLAVIRYFPPRVWPSRKALEPLWAEGERFPVVIRPWAPTSHAASHAATRSCWVRFDTAEASHCGVLTAGHTITPAGALPGAAVAINANRNDPTGRLHAGSPVMDAAVVDLGEDVHGTDVLQVSSVVGYKPVRLTGKRGAIDTEVIEFSGVVASTIPGARGQEPMAPVVLILGRRMQKGDSGSLGLDLEPTRYGAQPVPYLIYLGRTNVRLRNDVGYALLLEQPCRIWDLQVIQPPDTQSIGAPDEPDRQYLAG